MIKRSKIHYFNEKKGQVQEFDEKNDQKSMLMIKKTGLVQDFDEKSEKKVQDSHKKTAMSKILIKKTINDKKHSRF